MRKVFSLVRADSISARIILKFRRKLNIMPTVAYYSANDVARNLYRSFGFYETGEVVGNDIGMKLTISDIKF